MNPAHRDHDELLIVRIGSGDADAVDRAAGERQLASCEDCRTLLVDIHAIRSFSTREALRVPPRPRSFRIPPAELERLRGPQWRRWLAGFGAPRFDLARPLATAVAGLGLAVLVLGSAVPAAGPATAERQPTGAAAPGFGAASPAPAPGAYQGDNLAQRPAASTQGDAKDSATAAPVARLRVQDEREVGLSGTGESVPLPLAPIGAVVLASGLALVVLNTAARRAAGR